MENLEKFVEELFDKLHANRKPFYYYRPIPCEFDSELSNLVNVFMKATLSERGRIISAIPAEYAAFLNTFSERTAALGVRERSRQRILEGLIALIMEDYKGDWRENIGCLAPLYDSATKIGVDPLVLFTEAASYWKNESAEIISKFPLRIPEQRSLKSMLYKEVFAADGFRYEKGF
jgi:hypothetical protein